MKKIIVIRRVLSAFITAALALSFCACNGNGSSEDSGTKNSSMSTNTNLHNKITNYYTPSEFSFPDGLSYISDIQSTDDRLFLSGFSENETTEHIMCLYDTDSKEKIDIDLSSISMSSAKNVYFDGEKVYIYYQKSESDVSDLCVMNIRDGKILADIELGKNNYVSSMFIDKKDYLNVLTYGQAAVESQLNIYNSTDLKLIDQINLNDKASLGENEYVCFIVTDKDYNYYLFSQNQKQGSVSLYKFSSSFEKKGYIENITEGMTGDFSGAFIDSEKNIGTITCDHSTNIPSYSVSISDKESGKKLESIKPELGENEYIMPLTQIDGFDFVYADGSKLYGYKVKEKSSTVVVDYVGNVDEKLKQCYTVSALGSEFVMYADSNGDNAKLKSVVTDFDGKFLYDIKIPCQGNSIINNISVMADNTAVVGKIDYSATSDGEYSQTCTIHVVDDKGSISGSFEVSGKQSSDKSEGYYGGVYAGNNSNIYIPYSISNNGNGKMTARLMVYDTQGNQKYYIDDSSIAVINSVLVCKSADYLYYTDINGIGHVSVIDDATKKLGDEVDFGIDVNYMSGIFRGDGKYDFYYFSSDGVYGFDISEKKSVEVINWVDSDISFDVQKVCILNDNKILCYVWDYNLSDTRMYILDRADDSKLEQIQKKEVITLAGVDLSDSVIYDAILFFNANSEGYRIKLNDYARYAKNDGDVLISGEDKLNEDIAAGNIPDIIIGNYSVDMATYTSSGIFADFNDFFKRDGQLSKSDYHENIFDIYTTDGKLCQLPVAFSVRTLAGKKSELGDKTGWTFDEFFKYAENKKMFYNAGKSELLPLFVTENLAEFVDFKNKKCNFDNDTFIKILEFINNNGLTGAELQKAKDEMRNNNSANAEGHKKYLERFSSDSCFVEKEEYSDFSEPASFVQNTLNEDVCFRGIPSSDGNGSLICADILVAISEKSDKKDAAWGFVRGLLMEQFQAGITSSYPINKAVFDYYLQLGETEVSGSSAENINGEYVDVKPLDASTAQSLVSAVTDASAAVISDSVITNIVNEQAYKFFDGSQSSADAAKEIQSKVLSYLKTIK